MKRSRNTFVLITVLALVGSACSRFVPKADVSINKVGVDLAFGVDVEQLLEPPPIEPAPPFIFELPPTPPLPPLPPPPPETPFCLPNNTLSPRDGQAPTSIKPGEFNEKDPERGGNYPRRGSYPTFYQGNYSGEEAFNAFAYKKIGVWRENKQLSLFYYGMTDEGHGVSMDFTVVYDASSGEGEEDPSNANLAGLYLRQISLPEKADRSKSRVYIPANAESGGLKLASFPLGGGQVTQDTQPNRSANDQEIEGQTLPLSPPTATLSSNVVIAGKPQNVFVCDQLAQAWRFNTSIEITGDVDVTLVGSFWIATQYGGWPIQEAFTLDGGDTFISGNFYSRLARLDPGEVL